MKDARNTSNHMKKTSKLIYALYIGFFAGLIWGGVKVLEFALRFTEVVPGFLLEPFMKHSFLASWQGVLTGWLSLIALSVVASFIYMWVMRRLPGPWYGIGYGLTWWCLLYLLVGPLTGMIPGVTQLDLNSFVSDLCLFTLWGMFIGYSIAVEFNDEWAREPANA